MNKDTLVSINVVIENRLANPTKVPILFYWSGDDENDNSKQLRTTLLSDDKMKSLVANSIKTANDFFNGSVNYFYFEYIDDQEKYTEGIIKFSEIVKISEIPVDNIWSTFIIDYFTYLYKRAYGIEFEVKNPTDDIITIFAELKKKYPTKVTKNVITNYISSRLRDTALSPENKEYLMTNLNWLIK